MAFRVQLYLHVLHHSLLQANMMLFKADIDAAYRRVPLAADNRKYAAVVYKTKQGVMLSEHYALPFGGVGSVYGWDRVGSCICLT